MKGTPGDAVPSGKAGEDGVPAPAAKNKMPAERESRNAHELSLTTQSAQETFDLGRRLSEGIKGRTVFLLSGDLGTGKTILAKGIAAGLGIDPRDITSPTFTLVDSHQGRLKLYHIDLYRLDDSIDRELGLEEMLEEPEAVTVIEWAERLRVPPPGAVEVRIEHIAAEGRRFEIRQAGDVLTNPA